MNISELTYAINATANLTTFVSLIIFIIAYFGSPKSKIYERKPHFAAFFLKLGIIIICLNSFNEFTNYLTTNNYIQFSYKDLAISISLTILSVWLALESYFDASLISTTKRESKRG